MLNRLCADLDDGVEEEGGVEAAQADDLDRVAERQGVPGEAELEQVGEDEDGEVDGQRGERVGRQPGEAVLEQVRLGDDGRLEPDVDQRFEHGDEQEESGRQRLGYQLHPVFSTLESIFEPVLTLRLMTVMVPPSRPSKRQPAFRTSERGFLALRQCIRPSLRTSSSSCDSQRQTGDWVQSSSRCVVRA